MKHWVFNKKELRFIANLLVDKLCEKPDGTEIGINSLFEEVLEVEYVEWEEEGWKTQGMKIKDIELKNGKFLHDYIKWDFENGAWWFGNNNDYTISVYFYKIAKRRGFLIDHSHKCGRIVGTPFIVPNIYRNKIKFIKSFNTLKTEIVIGQNRYEKYYVKKQTETRHYHSEVGKEMYDYDITKEMQLWRLPKECNSGIISIANYRGIMINVLNGKCEIEMYRWMFIPQNRKNKWKKQHIFEDLKSNQGTFWRNNDKSEEETAPDNAWFKINNKGKVDLLLYVYFDD